MKLIVFALKAEARVFLSQLRQVRLQRLQQLKLYHGQWDKTAVTLAITGVGRESVQRNLPPLFEHFLPEAVLSIGYGGGLEPSLASGTLCQGISVQGFGEILPLQTDYFQDYLQTRIWTSETIVQSPQEKLHLYQQHQTEVVEMESYHVVQIMNQKGIPVTCVRIVLDAQSDPLYDLDFVKPSGAISPVGLARFVVQKPKSFLYLADLQRKGRLASQQIAQTAKEWLKRTSNV